MPSRDATTHWEGGLNSGQGNVTLESSNAGQFNVSFPARAADTSDGRTSPEELIAAAHSSCLAMNLSGVLESEGLTPESIDVSSEVTLGPADGGFAISGIAVTLRAKVDGVDADKFAQLAKTAEETCPVSKALAGTTITLDASLAG